MKRWQWFACVLGVIMGHALLQGSVSAWEPSKPVELIIPAGPGGGADVMARFIAPLVSKYNLSPRPVVAVNKSGGGGDVAINLVGKHVDSTVNNPNEAVSHWKAGRLRPLGLFDSERLNLPDWQTIPTMKEQGYDIEYLMLRGFFGAPGISPDAQAWYIRLLQRVADTPEWKEFTDTGGLKRAFLSGPGFVTWLEHTEALHKDLMTKGGLIKP